MSDFELAHRLHAEELRRKRAEEALEYADAQFARSLASDEGEGESEVSPSSVKGVGSRFYACLLYTSPSPRDLSTSRMPSSA